MAAPSLDSRVPWQPVNKLSYRSPSASMTDPGVSMPEPLHRLWPRWEEGGRNPPSVRHEDRPSVSVRSIADACHFYEKKCASIGYDSVASRYLYQLSREVKSQLRAAEHHLGEVEADREKMRATLKDWRDTFSPTGKFLCSDVPRMGIPLKSTAVLGCTPSDAAAAMREMSKQLKELKEKNAALSKDQLDSEGSLKAVLESHMSASTASASALRAQLAKERQALEQDRKAFKDRLQAEVDKLTVSCRNEVARLEGELFEQKKLEVKLRNDLRAEERSQRRQSVEILKKARSKSQCAWTDDSTMPFLRAGSDHPGDAGSADNGSAGELSKAFQSALEESKAEVDLLKKEIASKDRLLETLAKERGENVSLPVMAALTQREQTIETLREFLDQKEKLCEALRGALFRSLRSAASTEPLPPQPVISETEQSDPVKPVEPWDLQPPRRTDEFIGPNRLYTGKTVGAEAVFQIVRPSQSSRKKGR